MVLPFNSCIIVVLMVILLVHPSVLSSTAQTSLSPKDPSMDISESENIFDKIKNTEFYS